MMNKLSVDLFLTPKEVAELLGVTVQGVHKFLKEQGVESSMPTPRQRRIYPASMRRIASLKGLKLPRGVIAIHLVKGGVGKTTLVHALAARSSALGCRVLMVDLDQQANLTSSFGVTCRPKSDPTLGDVFAGQINGKKITIRDAIVPVTDFLHIVPANLSLANLDIAILQGTENLATLFSELFKPVRKDYDLIFLDCPPSLSRVTTAAQCFADRVILPVNTDRFSMDGLELTLGNLLQVLKKFGVSADLHVAINKFDARQKLGFEIINELSASFSDYLCETYISVSKQIDNSIESNECLWNAKGKNVALEDFHNLLVEIFDLNEWKSKRGPQKGMPGATGRRREVAAHA